MSNESILAVIIILMSGVNTLLYSGIRWRLSMLEKLVLTLAQDVEELQERGEA